MIFWRVRFDDTGMFGYQVMTPELNVIGIYDDEGQLVLSPGDYTTIDSGSNPVDGVTPPPWAGQINA